MSKVLFILKRREDYNSVLHSNIGLSTGLYNSAKFMNDMLKNSGVESKLVVVEDNNSIDREVNQYQPTHVIIEALWVVPEKFEILQKLHPNVQWIIRLHSEMPFMAGEGMAMDWLGKYSTFKNIKIACNAPRMMKEVSLYLAHRNNWTSKQTEEEVIYLPNYYPQDFKHKTFDKNKEYIHISCFGAIRPLKNHLVQAIAAIQFANSIGKKLVFHVNAGRIEMKGEPMINNLTGLFNQIAHQGHHLINHQWKPREEFLEICSRMDIGMQCSFSETFNIVGADMVSQGVPLVGSSEIPWTSSIFSADPTSSRDMFYKLHATYTFPKINVWTNQFNLKNYTNKTKNIWIKYFKK